MNLIERDDPRYFTETSSEPYDRHHYKVIKSTGEHVGRIMGASTINLVEQSTTLSLTH